MVAVGLVMICGLGALAWFAAGRAQGRLVVEVVPFGTISVDGREVASGLSYKELELGVGDHEVEATLVDPSFPEPKRQRATVRIEAGATQRLTLDLLK